MAPKGPNPRVIYWFRTDLRLHDSPALKAALDLSAEAFYPIWTWDPHYVYRARVGPNRWQFLYAALPWNRIIISSA
jgi:cryptochrome